MYRAASLSLLHSSMIDAARMLSISAWRDRGLDDFNWTTSTIAEL
jgi:hypothetical protein